MQVKEAAATLCGVPQFLPASCVRKESKVSHVKELHLVHLNHCYYTYNRSDYHGFLVRDCRRLAT